MAAEPYRKAEAVTAARDRLLAAADELFYQEGVQSVGIDRIVQIGGGAVRCRGEGRATSRPQAAAGHRREWRQDRG
jgi:hypothetical protein